MTNDMNAPTHGLLLANALRAEADESRIEYRAELMRNAAAEIESLCQILKDCGIAGSKEDGRYCQRAIRFHNDLIAVLQSYLAEDRSPESVKEATLLVGEMDKFKTSCH